MLLNVNLPKVQKLKLSDSIRNFDKMAFEFIFPRYYGSILMQCHAHTSDVPGAT